MSDTVLLERHDNGVAVVTLNRPDAMNALSAELRSALCKQMQRIRDDDERIEVERPRERAQREDR